MRRILTVSLALYSAIVTGLLWKEVTAHAAAGGTPVGNGDVDGNGKIDLSDAIYILGWLFIGTNEAPVPIECPPPGGGALPATGQDDCYRYREGEGWFPVPCGEAEIPGQDGAYGAGCPRDSRFFDNGDGTVTDSCTGLIWQRKTADIDQDGLRDTGDLLTWQEALQYCENLDFAGHTDWRLPNVREMLSIVDYGNYFPAVDGTVFEVPPSEGHWTSSTVARPGSYMNAWFIRFADGACYEAARSTKGYVLAVRGGL